MRGPFHGTALGMHSHASFASLVFWNRSRSMWTPPKQGCAMIDMGVYVERWTMVGNQPRSSAMAGMRVFHGQSMCRANVIHTKGAAAAALVQRCTTSARSTANVGATVKMHTRAANARAVVLKVTIARACSSSGSATLHDVWDAVQLLMEQLRLAVWCAKT